MEGDEVDGGDDPGPEEPPNVLVVCTANICRSPMAAPLLSTALTRAGIEANVTSAGFLEGGRPAQYHAVAVMNALGVDISGHRSRQLTRALVAQQDLILTMTRDHVRDLGLTWPDARGRTFTFGWLAQATQGPGSLDPDELDAWLAGLDAGRPTHDLLGSGADEVPDPMGRPRRTFALTAQALERHADAVAALLAQPVASRLPGPAAD